MARLGDQSGMSLPEVLLASVLMLMLLFTALTPFEVAQRTERVTSNQNDSQDNARTTLDILQRQLRNVAGQSQLVNRAGSYDLVFETVNPGPKPVGSQNARNIKRVRYCLDTTNAPASVTNGRLWEQTLTWTTASVPATMPGAGCPDAGWGTSRVVTQAITNRNTTASRPAQAPLFIFYPAPATNPPTNAELNLITQIRVDMLTDVKPNEYPGETRLTTGVFLRNQNGAPTAAFVSTPGGAGTRQITLNGSTSSDPENLPLTFRWCDVTSNSTCDDTTKIGTGALFTYTAPAAGTRQILLQVFDAGGLQTNFGPIATVAP